MKYKEETQKRILQEIEDMFNKHRISGIIHIPNVGVISMFISDKEKLSVLEQARTEIQCEDVLRQRTAEIWAFNKIKHQESMEKRENKGLSYAN